MKKRFTNLALFADFIVQHHLEEYVREGLKISFAVKLPIMKFFKDLDERQLFELSIQGSRDLLQGLADGNEEEMLRISLERWKNNQLPGMEKDEVVTEDITLLTHVRKKSLLPFIPRFTSDPQKIIELIGEIDEWTLDYATETFNMFIGLLRERISRQLEQLKESDQLFKQAQAVTHIGNYVWEPDSQKLTWSDELYRIYELDPATTTITNEIAYSFHHPDDLIEARRSIQEAKEANRPFDFYYRILTKDGRIKILHARGETVIDNKSVRVLGTAQDVTQQKEIESKLEDNIRERIKTEEALVNRTVELQQSNASLQEFAFIASHDLKEPLRKISTLGDRLRLNERDNLTDSGKVYVDKMINAALRMQQMVDDMLTLSQISNDTHFERTDLNHLLHDVLQNFETRLESLNASIEPGHLPEAVVVPSQFRQLFQNLISNSLKFTVKDRPPKITIKCTRIEEKDVEHLAVRKAPTYLKLSIADNGIGFDSQFSDKIFTIFQRLHSKSEYEGTGIGLAICRKIVENHGGSIQASGKVDEGTVFTIIIPQE